MCSATVQAAATIKVAPNTAQSRFRLTRFIKAGENDLQHALRHIAVALGVEAVRARKEVRFTDCAALVREAVLETRDAR